MTSHTNSTFARILAIWGHPGYSESFARKVVELVRERNGGNVHQAIEEVMAG